MEKKRIYPEQTPPQNIPYASANKKLPFSYIVPKDETVIIEQDANGVLYLSTGISKVATPVLTVDGYTVSAVCATEGAVIYYTTDGSTPSINSSVYSTPVTMQGKEFRFVAVKNGMVNSDEASATTGINYFRFVAVENKASILMKSQLNTPPVLEYSIDGGEIFNLLDFSFYNGIYTSETIDLDAGDVVYMRGKNDYFAFDKAVSTFDIVDGVARAEGNIMTLLDFVEPDSKILVNEHVFEHLFYGCTGLTAAPELPATTLASNCYSNMFYCCKRLNSVTIQTLVWNSGYTANWLCGVSNSGTFTKPSTTDMGTAGPSTVPVGWTVIDV